MPFGKRTFIMETKNIIQAKDLMRKLINAYRARTPFNGYEELYKWELLDATEGKDVLDIIKSLRGKNIVANAYVDGGFKYLIENKPDELKLCMNHLLDESIPIDKRLATYKSEMRNICPKNWKNFANDERTASAILMCKYPDKYTIYKNEIYTIICDYLGIKTHKTGLKFSHLMEIIDEISEEYGDEILQITMPEIAKFHNKPKKTCYPNNVLVHERIYEIKNIQ